MLDFGTGFCRLAGLVEVRRVFVLLLAGELGECSLDTTPLAGDERPSTVLIRRSIVAMGIERGSRAGSRTIGS